MPTIARVKWPKMDIDYGNLFKISSVHQLTYYWNDVKQNKLREGFANYLNSNEYVSLMGQGIESGTFNPHLSTNEASFLHCASLTEAYKDNPRSMVEVFCDISDKLYKDMANAIQEFGAIYINNKGGYFTLGADMEESNIQNIDQYILPGAKIEIKKWPNGTHFYAYVGGVSVVWNNKNKWTTEAAAQINAEQWAKDKGIKK